MVRPCPNRPLLHPANTAIQQHLPLSATRPLDAKNRGSLGVPRVFCTLFVLAKSLILWRVFPNKNVLGCLWYRRAAEAGFAPAEFNIAVMYDSGVGTARNAAEAAVWYARAAAHGNARAEYNLAQLYTAGDGVPRNLDVAEAWYCLCGSWTLGCGEKACVAACTSRPSCRAGRRNTGTDARNPDRSSGHSHIEER